MNPISAINPRFGGVLQTLKNHSKGLTMAALLGVAATGMAGCNNKQEADSFQNTIRAAKEAKLAPTQFSPIVDPKKDPQNARAVLWVEEDRLLQTTKIQYLAYDPQNSNEDTGHFVILTEYYNGTYQALQSLSRKERESQRLNKETGWLPLYNVSTEELAKSFEFGIFRTIGTHGDYIVSSKTDRIQMPDGTLIDGKTGDVVKKS